MGKRIIVFGICILSLVVLFSGCVDIPDESIQFLITSFDVEPSIINQGETANLSWVVIGAISVNIDNGICNVSLTGTRIITPIENTTYTLTATNSITSITATTQIIVTNISRTTEFYILGPTGTAEGYPTNLSAEENATVIIGVANHEYQTINYTIEIWLFNYSIYEIDHMWFVDKITTTLEHTDVKQSVTPQWEYNYSFAINRKGSFKLVFLLFTTSREEYTVDEDYVYKELPIIAYKNLHLWIDVT